MTLSRAPLLWGLGTVLASVCPYETCQGRHFRHHQEVDKPLKDTEYDAVFAHRYECLRCKRTFRLYPRGVTRAQTSQRVKGLGVMLYLLGLSYGATSLALEALVFLSSEKGLFRNFREKSVDLH